jgi:hypothetical protein
MKHWRNPLIGATLVALLVVLGIGQSKLQQTAQAQNAGAVQAPKFEVDPTFPKPLPNGMYQGQSIGLFIDQTNDHVWIVHRPDVLDAIEGGANGPNATAECCKNAPPILEFDPAGNLLRSWGGSDGPGYQWPDSNHGLNIDNKGNVWIGGNGGTDGHILKFTQDGKFLMQVGKKGVTADSLSKEHFFMVAETFFYAPTNEVFVADGYGNRRTAVVDPDTGAVKRFWGAYGKPPDDKVSREQGAYDPNISSTADRCTARWCRTTASFTCATAPATASRCSRLTAPTSKRCTRSAIHAATDRCGTSNSRRTPSSAPCMSPTAATRRSGSSTARA